MSRFTKTTSRLSALIVTTMVLAMASFGEPSLDKNGFGHASPNLADQQKVSLWSTYYYVHEAKYAENGLPLNDADGKPTGVRLANCDWCDAAIEGTVRTFDSKGKAVTLNYAKLGTEQQCDCQASCGKYANYKNKKIGYTLWVPARGEFGDGVSGYKLVPFRTVAVDRTFIAIGSLIFVPQAVGVAITLPNGEISRHDGYFFAADIGGDIKANHIDTFFGYKGRNPFNFITSKPEGVFDAYIIRGSAVETALATLHK